MLRNCDCGACCEACGHYDGCIRNAGRERDVAAEVAMEDGYRFKANPVRGQRSEGSAA
jgi:hypothetical protein